MYVSKDWMGWMKNFRGLNCWRSRLATDGSRVWPLCCTPVLWRGRDAHGGASARAENVRPSGVTRTDVSAGDISVQASTQSAKRQVITKSRLFFDTEGVYYCN